MKLILFGATGTIGRHLAEQALSQGHQVTAFTRNPAKYSQHGKNLQVVEGDVRDLAAVERAIEGHDGVLCALGMPLMNKDKLRAAGTRNIVTAMQKTGVKRLVCLSAFGTGDSRSMLPIHYRYIIVPLAMRRLFADHELQEGFVESSALDWVIVRAVNFSKGARTRSYRHGFTAADASPKLRISHADVADFMLQQLTSDDYLHQAPGLSY